jgi:hypothetical protein
MPKSLLKLGFDANIRNSCYQTASMVALFSFPSRFIHRRLYLRKRQKQIHFAKAKDLLLATAQQLARADQQLSTLTFLQVRQELADVPCTWQFSTSDPNDAAEWIQNLLTIMDFPEFLVWRPHMSSHILSIGVKPLQRVQVALDSVLLEHNLQFTQQPPLVILNIQRELVWHEGRMQTQAYKVRLDSRIRLKVKTREHVYVLSSVIVMNEERNHYATYLRKPFTRQWFFFSDIGGEFRALQPNFALESMKSVDSLFIARHAHVLIYAIE